MTGVIRWEEPPRKLTADEMRAEQFASVADELRGKPGEWAVIYEGRASRPGQMAAYVKAGKGPFAPKGAYEARSQTSGGSGRTYARYVGDPS